MFRVFNFDEVTFRLMAIGFGVSVFYFSRFFLGLLKEKCDHRWVKSVECLLDEDSDPKTTHYEITCKICGHKWLHTPISQKRKRKSNKNKKTSKNKK